ncbi:hypothetical protein KKC45_04300 [Patescibacteria group bacterium]|nr:hypothetical protein [Patescibacteria group bacterium]
MPDGKKVRSCSRRSLARTLVVLLIVGPATGCSWVARAGGRYVHADHQERSRHGGEAVVSMDLWEQVGYPLKDAKGEVSFLFPSIGLEASLGYLHGDGELTADHVMGSGFLTATGNLLSTFSGRQSYRGVRFTGGIGFRTIDVEASFAIQGSAQVLVGTFADGSVMLEAFVGYLPGDETPYIGVGFSIANFDHGGYKEVAFGVR